MNPKNLVLPNVVIAIGAAVAVAAALFSPTMTRIALLASFLAVGVGAGWRYFIQKP